MKAMENPQITGHPMTALFCTLLSIISGLLASITSNVELYVRIGAGVIAMGSGLMAARYYFYATKEKLQSLKNKNQNSN